jgi:hypothetical protein
MEIDMWNEFSDFELAELAFNYGLGDNLSLTFSDRLQLVNRAEIEQLLTEVEHEIAYGDK